MYLLLHLTFIFFQCRTERRQPLRLGGYHTGTERNRVPRWCVFLGDYIPLGLSIQTTKSDI